MNRYLFSFTITLLIFSFIIFLLIYFIQTPIEKRQKTQSKNNSIKFRIIKQEKKKEPIIEKIIKKPTVKKLLPKKETIEKKISIKKIIKKNKPKLKPKPIPKKAIQREIKKAKEKTHIKKKVVKKKLKKEIIPTLTSQIKPIIKEIIKKDDFQEEEKEKEKKNYYLKVKSAINENKSYPNKAKKRNIQGTVKIQFTLSNKGKLLSYKILEGKKIFKKSIINAIENSFPIKTPKNIFNSNINLSLSLEYKLYQ